MVNKVFITGPDKYSFKRICQFLSENMLIKQVNGSLLCWDCCK